jgi:GMP synthase (glutamine-hydrolysing)
VAAVLIHEAIGDQLTCVFVDHGLLRLGEAEQVVTMFRDHYNMPLIHADETTSSSARWKASPTPRSSARPSAAVHRRVPETRQRGRRGQVPGAGHALPRRDRVVVLGGPSVTIKSHHNVGGLPEKMGLKLVEPLRELFKDEVRALGRELGLPQLHRPPPRPRPCHPLPGRDHREKLDILRRADAVYIDQIRRHGLYDEIWQAFAVILPMRTVGVMGDGRPTITRWRCGR